MRRFDAVLISLAVLAFANRADAQPFENLGTRALGMAGAFVAVADDATAVAWNPAGLAGGPFFNLLVERSSRRREADTLIGAPAVDQSASGFAMATLPLGVSYYRRRYTTARGSASASDSGALPVSSLVSHHTGVTLLHSITPGIVIGTTLKFVRGVAATGSVEARTTDDALDRAVDLIGRATNRFDADVGALLVTGPFRAGLTVRNLVEPSFAAPSGEELPLEREVRAGVAWIWRYDTTVALDADLSRPHDETRERQLAIGVEQRSLSRVAFRGGVRFATEAEADPLVALGASVAIRSGVWIDGFWNGGRDDEQAWGVAARLAY